MECAGFLVGYASAYLRSRNWIQLCLMGGVPWQTLRQACRTLRMIMDAFPATAPAFPGWEHADRPREAAQ
jgi:hypothetical protein